MNEPTAALDPVAEYEVFAGFDRMAGGEDSREELVEQEGVYQELWNKVLILFLCAKITNSLVVIY